MEATEVQRFAAFAVDGRGGNPAGVVLDAGGLGDVQRSAIAADLGYSETAFVEAPDPTGARRTRYWSPRAEVDFCGHATVAAAVAIAERRGPGRLVLSTRIGEVPVLTTSYAGRTSATLTSVETSTVRADTDVVSAALAALGWDITDLHPDYPPHVAYAGNHHLILAASTRDRLARLDYDYDALADLMTSTGWTTVHLFTPTSARTYAARDPFPPGGVVEDPATGAAAAAFGGYLRTLGLAPDDHLTVVQGEDMGRPSRLQLDLSPYPRVRVTGTAVPITETDERPRPRPHDQETR